MTLIAILLFFQNPRREQNRLSFKQKIGKMDIIGAFLLIAAMTCLLIALNWGGTTYPWSDSKVWGCILGFGLLALVFTTLQYHLDDEYAALLSI